MLSIAQDWLDLAQLDEEKDELQLKIARHGRKKPRLAGGAEARDARFGNATRALRFPGIAVAPSGRP